MTLVDRIKQLFGLDGKPDYKSSWMEAPTPPRKNDYQEQIEKGFEHWGSPPAATLSATYAKAPGSAPIFDKYPFLLPAQSLAETSGGAKQKFSNNPQNWGIRPQARGDYNPTSPEQVILDAMTAIGGTRTLEDYTPSQMRTQGYYDQFRNTGDLMDFASVYAPPGENDTAKYVQDLLDIMSVFEAAGKKGGGELPEDQKKGAQDISTWCGPAALQFILKKYGEKTTQKELAEMMETNKDGTDDYNLVRAAKKLGHTVSVFEKGDPEETLEELDRHAKMGHYAVLDYIMGTDLKDDGHFAVFMGKDGDKIKLWNPWDGKEETRDTKSFIKKWKGIGDDEHKEIYRHWAAVIE